MNNINILINEFTIYYVNNGKVMSHGDVQRKKKKDGTEEIILHSYLMSYVLVPNSTLKGICFQFEQS